jgi:hypothetical protein
VIAVGWLLSLRPDANELRVGDAVAVVTDMLGEHSTE